MRIMIVDDNELMRKEISKSVALQTDAVLECEDGESAIVRCLDFNPDWILMDIKMKKMNGIIAAEKIKAVTPEVNIAIVTSYDSYLYRDAARKLGIKHFFMKTNLLDIRRVLDSNRQK